jgi:SHAQKYF class myb-like DNA-binding protein
MDAHCRCAVEHTIAGDGSGKALHKSRVVWTEELHQRFLMAIDAAGEDAAVPTVILKVQCLCQPWRHAVRCADIVKLRCASACYLMTLCST